MFLTGLLYLVFEETFARNSKSHHGASSAVSSSSGSRIIMGMQVCCQIRLAGTRRDLLSFLEGIPDLIT